MSVVEQPATAGFLLGQLSDDEVVKRALDAQEAAEEAEAEAGSDARWAMADSFLELSERGWSHRAIAEQVGMQRRNVGFYVQSAKIWNLGTNRPTFAFAYKEAKGEKLDPLHDSQTDEWETPQDLFDALDAEFGFTLDVCATADNAKCADYFTENSLGQQWRGTCWMNPPYSQIDKWMAKASEEAARGVTVVCLVPARTDTAWWWDNARQGEVRFLRGRLKFGGAKNGAPFPSAVVVLSRAPDTVYWDWRA